MSGKIEVGTCDACRRDEVRVENMVIDGQAMKLCTNIKACRNSTNVAELFRDTDRLIGKRL